MSKEVVISVLLQNNDHQILEQSFTPYLRTVIRGGPKTISIWLNMYA